MDNEIYRWVKASERLPEIPNYITDDTLHFVFRNMRQGKVMIIFPHLTPNIPALLKDENLENWTWAEPIPEQNQEAAIDDIENIFDKHTAPTGGGYEADYTDRSGFLKELSSKYHLIKKPITP